MLQGSDDGRVSNVVKSSEPLVPPEMFVTRAYSRQQQLLATVCKPPTLSLLAVCSGCGVCVHRSELLHWSFSH